MTFPFPYIRHRNPGNDSFTKILLHLNGINTGTSFPDIASGGGAHTWTANGSAQTSTTTNKFNGSSLLLNGTTDWIDTPDSTDYTIGANPGAIDFWFNRQGGFGSVQFICGQSDSAGTSSTNNVNLFFTAGNVLSARAVSGSTPVTVTGTTVFSASGWNHAAFTWDGSNLRLFLNGIQEGGNVAFSSSINDSANKFAVGRLGELAGNLYNGFMQEFRLSIGNSRWTANFTPSTIIYG